MRPLPPTLVGVVDQGNSAAYTHWLVDKLFNMATEGLPDINTSKRPRSESESSSASPVLSFFRGPHALLARLCAQEFSRGGGGGERGIPSGGKFSRIGPCLYV